jgi:esterase/lipase superfamily enzyme
LQGKLKESKKSSNLFLDLDMKRTYTKWKSLKLGREMELLHFGHAGTPLLVFPSSMGRFYEWEDFGMIEALKPQIESGLNQIFCVDSIDRESFYNREVNPYTRVKRHQQYEQYIIEEVLPHIRRTAQNDFVMVTGASFGAYHATSMVFKHPRKFGKLIALSGAYSITSFMDGFYDDNVYFANPLDYLPNLSDPTTLDAMRKDHIILSCGKDDPCREPNERLSKILHQKGIPHTFDLWDGFGHDWDWWTKMLKKHIG